VLASYFILFFPCFVILDKQQGTELPVVGKRSHKEPVGFAKFVLTTTVAVVFAEA
jgi:hypothetical protein